MLTLQWTENKTFSIYLSFDTTNNRVGTSFIDRETIHGLSKLQACLKREDNNALEVELVI